MPEIQNVKREENRKLKHDVEDNKKNDDKNESYYRFLKDSISKKITQQMNKISSISNDNTNSDYNLETLQYLKNGNKSVESLYSTIKHIFLKFNMRHCEYEGRIQRRAKFFSTHILAEFRIRMANSQHPSSLPLKLKK